MWELMKKYPPLGATCHGWYKSISGSSSHFIAQAMLPNPLDLNTIDDRGHGDLSFYRFWQFLALVW
jgi:hypothetical protein